MKLTKLLPVMCQWLLSGHLGIVPMFLIILPNSAIGCYCVRVLFRCKFLAAGVEFLQSYWHNWRFWIVWLLYSVFYHLHCYLSNCCYYNFYYYLLLLHHCLHTLLLNVSSTFGYGCCYFRIIFSYHHIWRLFNLITYVCMCIVHFCIKCVSCNITFSNAIVHCCWLQ